MSPAVVSQNYPQENPNNLEYMETITTEAWKVLVLDFTTFDIELHHNCNYDSLAIVDHNGTTLKQEHYPILANLDSGS